MEIRIVHGDDQAKRVLQQRIKDEQLCEQVIIP